MTRRLRAATLFAAALASGCVNILPDAAPPPARFSLEPAAFAENAGAPVAWSLVVADPGATRAYDTVKIATVFEDGRLEYFTGGEWADRGPSLIRTAVIRSFENSGRILNVGDDVSIPIGDFSLQIDIRAFHVENAGDEPTAVADLYARLADRRGRIVAARRFTETRDGFSTMDIDAVARAFNAATQSVMTELVPWAFEEAEVAASARREGAAAASG